jgi:Tfp pilus assembly protein PilN
MGADKPSEMKAINLLPPDSRTTPKAGATKAVAATEEPGGIGAFVLLGALAVCVVALAAYVLTTNSVKDRQAQLDAATAQAQSTAQRAAQLKPYADFKQMAETRIQTVKDLAASRFDWEQALRDISRAIPSDVTLTSLNGSISSAAGGGSSSTVRGAIAAPAVTLQGCTTGQKQVATLLSRLRSVDGVTRVTLTKSAKPDEAADTGAVAADAATAQIGCGTGRPPSFELVMFFERSEVPNSVADITVSPSAGATPASTGSGAASGSGTTPATQGTTGVTTPPADPGADGNGTATPASTPQGGAAQ